MIIRRVYCHFGCGYQQQQQQGAECNNIKNEKKLSQSLMRDNFSPSVSRCKSKEFKIKKKKKKRDLFYFISFLLAIDSLEKWAGEKRVSERTTPRFTLNETRPNVFRVSKYNFLILFLSSRSRRERMKRKELDSKWRHGKCQKCARHRVKLFCVIGPFRFRWMTDGRRWYKKNEAKGIFLRHKLKY